MAYDTPNFDRMLGNPLCKQIPWSNDEEKLLAWKQVCITVLLSCTVMYDTILCCTVMYCSVLIYAVLFCTDLHCTVLYCSVLCMMHIVTGQVKQYPRVHYFGIAGHNLSVNVK